MSSKAGIPEAFEPRYDAVSQPRHYAAGDLECIDAIRAALTPHEFRGFCKGNALKYVWRERDKGGGEDLRKAVWYLRMADGDDPRETGQPEAEKNDPRFTKCSSCGISIPLRYIHLRCEECGQMP